MSVAVDTPDLLIRVHYRPGQFSFELKASDPKLNLNYMSFGPHSIKMDPETWSDHFFKKWEDQARQTGLSSGHSAEIRRLETLGLNLFEEVFPQDLQDLLWRIKSVVRTLQVLSDEPWIPWEICKLQSSGEGKIEEGPFFCEQFHMTRWITGSYSPTNRLPMKDVAIVGIGGRNLDQVEHELQILHDMSGNTRKVTQIPANLYAIQMAMEQGRHDAWHFAGHGNKPDKGSETSLPLDRGDLLEPNIISGICKNMAIPKPLIFFNACFSGRANLTLTKLGGWAHKFMNLGAGAFIGTQWAVEDGSALAFARAFYGYFLKGQSLGVAVNKARMQIKDRGDASWLAYVAFGDPSAKIRINRMGHHIVDQLTAVGEPIKNYINRHGLEKTRLAEILLEKSMGQSNYVKYMVYEISQGFYQNRPPDRLPMGLDNYYRDYIKNLRQARGDIKFQSHFNVLGILCVARESLDLSMLSAFSGESEHRVEEVLNLWKLFLDQGLKHAYELEPSFRKFLGQEGLVDREGAHRKMAQVIRGAFFPA